MKDIRIGNDINVKWSIFGDGAPYILEGKDVSLYLCTPFGKRKAEGFSIVVNQITWTFAGKDQSRTGKYSLELVVNEEKAGQVTTDACNFVNLVNCSCKVGGADEANVTTESIELTSELGFLPYNDAELREAIATLEREKVDKEEGKGLSTNDYSDEEKEKNVVASFLNGASLQGLPFGYVGGKYQSYQFDGEVNEEMDLGQIAEYYYGNIAFSYADKLYEFKIADLKSEGTTLGTIIVRVNDDYHLIVKPFAPRVALLGWRTYGDRTKMPSAWVEGGGGASSDKQGVIRQTQTWTQAADKGYDYVMSNLVRGAIPQANIDLFTSAGAIFNEESGYFELNGLTDISYEEMRAIYNAGYKMVEGYWNNNIRTNIFRPCNVYNADAAQLYGFVGMYANRSCTAEVFKFTEQDIYGVQIKEDMYGTYDGCIYLKTFGKGVFFCQDSNISDLAFGKCYSLETIYVRNLRKNISFKDSARLSNASILYMVNNSAATSAITITLHADAYARAMADAEITAALEAHPNVSLASA